MKIRILTALTVFVFFNSCLNPKHETTKTIHTFESIKTVKTLETSETYEVFKFAVFENKPIFEDEYLYDYDTRKFLKNTVGNTEWYLIDWNNNGIFNEVNIDYYGVKSPFKNRPIISILKEKNDLNHNGISYSIDKETGFLELEKTDLRQDNEISYISDFIPIILSDGTVLESDIFKNYDKTVIYYWATWCAPCVAKLEQVEKIKEQLKKNKVNFIPIYYKCAYKDVKELNNKKGLNFEAKEVSDLTALSYQISALPETYVFDSNGKLIAEKYDID